MAGFNTVPLKQQRLESCYCVGFFTPGNSYFALLTDHVFLFILFIFIKDFNTGSAAYGTIASSVTYKFTNAETSMCL